MPPMRVLDLFSGIGGFSLGLGRAGMTTVGFCEIDPYCRAVLARHWPGVPVHADIADLDGGRLAAAGIQPDLVCGGFPCQDISVAGRNAGIDGARSGLWRQMLRIVGETAPRWVIIENVVALRSRGLEQVLGGLAALGYACEWHCIPAAAIGAPHRRDRLWLVAHPDSGGWREQGHEPRAPSDPATRHPARGDQAMANPGGAGLQGTECPQRREPVVPPADLGAAIAQRSWRYAEPCLGGKDARLPAGLDRGAPRPVEPWEGDTPRTVGRGYPDRRKRLIALGNSIVPQIAEMIGRAIMRAATSR